MLFKVEKNSAPSQHGELRELFFETSNTKTFKSETLKEAFFQRWAGRYLQQWPAWTFLETHEKRLKGYLVACPNTSEALSFLDQSSLYLYEDLLDVYPAHFHINLSAEARGKGVGSSLVKKLYEQLRKHQIPGVHIITSPEARNVGFYKKNGLIDCHERVLNGKKLLFMGKRF